MSLSAVSEYSYLSTSSLVPQRQSSDFVGKKRLAFPLLEAGEVGLIAMATVDIDADADADADVA